MSTNYVFDGTGETPWTEEDLPRPRSIYGLSKLAGEHAALAYAPDVLVVRTGGPVRRARQRVEGRQLRRADDRPRPRAPARCGWSLTSGCTPTATSDLAAALVQASDRGVGGLLHLTNAGACSWYEFTAAIMEEAGINVPIEPVATGGGGAARPLNGVLACARAEVAGLAPLPHWRDALRGYLARTELAAAA